MIYILEYSNIDEHWNAGTFTDLQKAKQAVIEFCKQTQKILTIIEYPENEIFVYDYFDESQTNKNRRIDGFDFIPYEVLPEWAKKHRSK